MNSVRRFVRGDESRWDTFVECSPGSHGYHRVGWKAVIEGCFGHKTYYLCSTDGQDNLNGVLPLVRLKSRLFGDFLVSLPYFNYGGPCADTSPVALALVEAAVRTAREERVEYVELRLTQPEGFGLAVRTSKVSMRLELPDEAPSLWSSFPAKLRSQINRPVKEGMIARVGTHEELDAFYDVFAANMRDLGTPVYPKVLFAAVLNQFPKDAWICNVYHRGRPVAGGFLVGFRGVLEIPWASSLRGVSRLAPNMLLYWRALEYACHRRYRTFDFGRSSPESGPYRFKKQWGAVPQPLYWHYWLSDGRAMPELNPANPRYRLAIDIWKRLPVGLTKLIGPVIVRNIP